MTADAGRDAMFDADGLVVLRTVFQRDPVRRRRMKEEITEGTDIMRSAMIVALAVLALGACSDSKPEALPALPALTTTPGRPGAAHSSTTTTSTSEAATTKTTTTITARARTVVAEVARAEPEPVAAQEAPTLAPEPAPQEPIATDPPAIPVAPPVAPPPSVPDPTTPPVTPPPSVPEPTTATVPPGAVPAPGVVPPPNPATFTIDLPLVVGQTTTIDSSSLCDTRCNFSGQITWRSPGCCGATHTILQLERSAIMHYTPTKLDATRNPVTITVLIGEPNDDNHLVRTTGYSQTIDIGVAATG